MSKNTVIDIAKKQFHALAELEKDSGSRVISILKN